MIWTLELSWVAEHRDLFTVGYWACEVLSPGTRAYDLRIKKPFYARIGVKHIWYVDLKARLLTESRLQEGGWLEVGVYGEDDVARAEPFGEVEVALADLWG